jgi:hypothetical protein
MSQSIVVPDATNYKTVSEFAPRYRYLPIYMNNSNTTTVTLGKSDSQMLQFQLPSGSVYNLSKSYIQYPMTTGDAPATQFNWLHEDAPAFFDSVELSISAGTKLCDLHNANKYGKVRMRQSITTHELLCADALSALYPCNLSTAYNLKAMPDNYQAGNIYGAGMNPATGLIVPGSSYAGITTYLEPQHTRRSTTAEAGAHTSVLTSYRQLPLGIFADTILGMDRDLFIPTDTYFRTVVSCPKLGFSCVSGTAPTDANSDSIAGGVTLNNVVLYLAVEQNAFIVDAIKTKFASSGLKFQIPFTTSFKNNTANPGTASAQIIMNRGQGKSIKKIMHTIWNVKENGASAFDCSNWNGSKLTSYATYIDSNKLQNADVSTLQPTGTNVNQSDWLMNRKFYQNSAVMNGGQYQLNWCHVDSFSEPEDHVGVPEENIASGLPITTQVTWQFQGEATTGLNHYTFVTFMKDVAILPDANIVSIY